MSAPYSCNKAQQAIQPDAATDAYRFRSCLTPPSGAAELGVVLRRKSSWLLADLASKIALATKANGEAPTYICASQRFRLEELEGLLLDMCVALQSQP